MGVRILGTVLDGIAATEVTVEARYSSTLRLKETKLVGLPDAAVKEGMMRARSACAPFLQVFVDEMQSGVLINLAPADLRKTGRSLDLPLAMVWAGILTGRTDPHEGGTVWMGELGLDGTVRPVSGILAALLQAKRSGRSAVVIPAENLNEARLIEGPLLYPVHTAEEALHVLHGEAAPDGGPRGPGQLSDDPSGFAGPDLSEVRGQFHARRALEIAAAGSHNVLFEGPPGSGKTMLARRLPTIMPPLDDEQAMETACIRSVVRTLDPASFRVPPFRAPHHTATPAGLTGGGVPIRPGEFSQAHHGVLFLDEMPEFDRRALEVLREPLEERAIHLTRASGVRRFPADFMLVGAMNPCPCGYAGEDSGRCRCTPRQVLQYRSRLSGPLLDRIDLRVNVRAVPAASLFDEVEAESSACIRKRVLAARMIQWKRGTDGGVNAKAPWLNARISDRQIRTLADYTPKEKRLLLKLVARHRLSARATRRLERVARTIADLAESPRVSDLHLMEALGLRLGGEMESRVEAAFADLE